MVTLSKEFFEVVRPNEVTVNCSEMWKAYGKAKEASGVAMQDENGNDIYHTFTWYGNEGLPVLPCYEGLSSDDDRIDVLFLTREQYEVLCNWWDNTSNYVLVSTKYNQYDLYMGHIDEIFVFDGDNSELIHLGSKINLHQSFFEAIKPYEAKVDCSEMWQAYEMAITDEFGTVDEDDTNSSTWYGNHGLPTLPVYEEFPGGSCGDVLFLTRRQYELFCEWQENNTVNSQILPDEVNDCYTLGYYYDTPNAIFIFDGENSELIFCR